MDPLSIAKGSASLVVLCVKLSATLYTWINETRQVDTNVTALYEEVLALSRVLDGISKAWKKNPQIASAQSDAGSLWVSVKTSIDDCQATIEKMNMMLDEVQKVGFMGRGFLRRPTKQIKFGLKTKDISVYKQRVQFYNNAMQSALHMINLCLLLQSNSSQETVSRTLSELKSQIGRVEIALVSREEQQISHDDDQKESERISKNLHQFVRAAEDFYSSASTVVGSRSTVWRGSILGDPLTRDQLFSIEEWIPPPHIVEENEQREENTSSTAFSASASDPYANRKSAADTDLTSAGDVHLSDSDSDIEKDLTKQFQKLAVLKLKERDYEKAEQFFHKAIDRSTTEAQPPEKITAMKVKLAFTYCFQGRWAEAESIIDLIGMDKQKVDVAASHGLHTLALLYFGKDDLETAEKYCKQALTGKKKLLGKDHASYFESINLLCRVYSAKGSQAESECYRSFLPVEHANELPKSPLDYLYKAISGKRIAAPSAAPDLIPSRLEDFPPPERITQSYIQGIQPVSVALNGSRRFIVGVDFGILDSAVAFGIQDSAFDVSSVAVVTNWTGASNRTLSRIPTVLYYDEQQKVVGWGTDVVDAISPIGWPKQGIQKLEWFKFQLMIKGGNSYLDAIKPPLLPPGKTEINVVTDFLSELHKATRLHFQSILGDYFNRIERDILYYFTVPAIFNEAARGALRAAAIQAGYLRDEHDHRLTLIEEPKALAIFCSETALLNLGKHDAFLIIACGGGTVDLISYQVVKEYPLDITELTDASGDTCGSMAVNQIFSNIVRAKIRKMKLPNGSKIAARIYAKCVMCFENRIKADFRNSGLKWAVDLGLETDFPEVDIEEGYMIYSNEEILQCFKPVVNRIIELVRNQIIAIQAQNDNLQKILVAGTFGANEYLFQQIKLHVPAQFQSKVIRPVDSANAAVRGAVTSATIMAKSAASKIAGHHILIDLLQAFQTDHHPDYYCVSWPDGRLWCKYTYEMIITKGEHVKFGQQKKLSVEKYVPLGEPLIFEDRIYLCDDKYCPTFVIDPRIKLVSTCTVDLSDREPESDFQKFRSPNGIYYLVRYDIYFTLDRLEIAVEVVFAGDIVGRYSARF